MRFDIFISVMSTTMKKIIFVPFLFLMLSAFTQQDSGAKIPRAYQANEVLEYRVHYGLITAGEAKMEVHAQHYLVNNKVCHKITITGKTSGSFDLVMTIRDTWGTYIDTATLVPQKNYRDIREGNYRLKENVALDYNTKQASVLHEYKDGRKETKDYVIPGGVQDLVSGSYFLRNINYGNLKIGDTIKVVAFFEEKVYCLQVQYKGKEKIHTKFGKINAIKLQPIMPNNETFNGGSSIRVWISDDYNKVPLKIEADMFVGAVAIDLKSYKGLKHSIKFE